jgi:hypothetical protein
MSSTFLVHMDVLHKPFLPWYNWRDSSCATSMFIGLKGCTELVFLALRLEFTNLLFSDEIFGIFNLLFSEEFEVINCSLSSIWDQPRIQFLVCNMQPSRGSGIPASRSSCSFFVQSGIAVLYPPGPSLCLNLFFQISSFILIPCIMVSTMQLLEGVPFVWCDELKPMERWNTRLNIELIECMPEPLKGSPYGKNGSPFSTFFMFRRKDMMCLYQFPQSFFLIYWNSAPIKQGDCWRS